MIFLNTKTKPNPLESGYWVDQNENPYGGIIKYYDDSLDTWVYLDEPRFQRSPASKITEEQLENINNVSDVSGAIISIQAQIDNLDSDKANKDDVLSKDYADSIHDNLTASINKNTGNIITLNSTLTNKIEDGDKKNNTRIEEVNGALTQEINSLRNAVQKGYDDTELRNAIAEKTSYTYVEQQIQNITGVPPTVLDTLEELADALGNDPNFATTITTLIGTKTTRDDVIEIVNDMLTDAGIAETDPTVPQWAKQSTKPSYIASEVGALPASTVIPEKTSQLTNDAGFLTQLEVNALIQANKPLNTEQHAKINKLDSYVIYNITEGSINLPTEYATIVVNVPADITELNVFFDKEPIVGSRFRLYINPTAGVSTNFHTLQNEVLHTAKVSTITRFDITAIDLTDYAVTTESGTAIISEGGSTIVVNLLDGYIIDYVDNSSNTLTWYEGE